MIRFDSIGQFRDFFEGVFYVFAVLAVLGGGYRYFKDQGATRRQRDDELDQRRREYRWRQAEASKGLLDGFMGDPQAANARQMLDSWDREFLVGRAPETITVARWQSALREGRDEASDPVSSFVRDSFDALFYHMAMFEHHIRNRFVTFDDVVFPMSYYVRIMREDKELYEEYMSKYGLDRSRSFLERFDVWNAERPLGVVV